MRSALLLAVLALACSDGTPPPTAPVAPVVAGAPAALQVVDGNNQAGTVGQELSKPLIVRVVDSAGRPVVGEVVNFKVTAGAGAMFAGSGNTNDSGVVQDRWTLGIKAADSQRVEARVVDSRSGVGLVLATFAADASPDVPSKLTLVKLSANPSFTPGGGADVGAKTTDQYANPIVAQPVTWTVVTGGGTIVGTALTDSTGATTAKWTLGAMVAADASDSAHFQRASVSVGKLTTLFAVQAK